MTGLTGRLRAALATHAPELPIAGDDPELRSQAWKQAAVLMAITDRPEPGMILTVRREGLRTHAGQIAFPGGRIEAAEDPVTAALREAHEELLLDHRRVEVLGSIEPYRTVTGYVITPVLGVVPPDLPLEPHEREVSQIFEAPLAYLLDPANQRRQTAMLQGRRRHYYEIIWGRHRIWGATAAMIVNLARRLQWR